MKICLEYCHALFVSQNSLLRTCVYEGYWMAITTAENEMMKCEALRECDTLLMRYQLSHYS